MKFMKQLASLAIAGGMLWAQFPTSKAALMQEAAKRLDTVAKKLKLSPDQIAKIKPLLTQQMEQTSAAREKFALSDHSEAAKQDALASIRSSRTSTSSDIRSTLSADQLKQCDEMVKGWKDDLNLKGLGSLPNAKLP